MTIWLKTKTPGGKKIMINLQQHCEIKCISDGLRGKARKRVEEREEIHCSAVSWERVVWKSAAEVDEYLKHTINRIRLRAVRGVRGFQGVTYRVDDIKISATEERGEYSSEGYSTQLKFSQGASIFLSLLNVWLCVEGDVQYINSIKQDRSSSVSCGSNFNKH